MKKISYFAKTFFPLLLSIALVACGSDDGGGVDTPVDIEAVYSVNAAKEVGDYTSGESLATVTDADGAISAASLGSGSLADGIALNGSNGELTVSDVGALVPGTYSLAITTEDVKGGTTDHTVSITLNENVDVAATYTVNDAKAVQDYSVGESIATVSDADGAIVSAILETGSELPAGTALNATTGEITVEDATLLVPGTYVVDITTEDEDSGTTMHMVTLVFNINPVIVNINSGGGELVFTDITYQADAFFAGSSQPYTPDPIPEIANTEMDELYISERFGSNFGYTFELENGTYKVILHFVELYWGAPGEGSAGTVGDRIFDVSIEGVVVIDDYDIFEEVGALFATQKEFEIVLTDGMLNIDFLASVDNGKIAAIEIEKIN